MHTFFFILLLYGFVYYRNSIIYCYSFDLIYARHLSCVQYCVGNDDSCKSGIRLCFWLLNRLHGFHIKNWRLFPALRNPCVILACTICRRFSTVSSFSLKFTFSYLVILFSATSFIWYFISSHIFLLLKQYVVVFFYVFVY